MQPLANEPLNRESDLTDPTVLAQLLAEDAQGLEVQANASGARPSAYGGMPDPSFFYGRCAAHMKAAAALLTGGPVAGKAGPNLAQDAAWEPGAAAPEKKRKTT